MTWWRGEARYEVFFNRDELKTRPRAIPPVLKKTASGTRYLTPHDPGAGGTWMLANEHRVTVCLLNRWHIATNQEKSYRSRGLLVLETADCSCVADVARLIEDKDLANYRPFTLVALDPEKVISVEWDANCSKTYSPTLPLTSSSYRFEEVSAYRKQRFQKLTIDKPADLMRYHMGEDSASAYTVRMNRPDAQTWSRSHVIVDTDQICWEYGEELPGLVDDTMHHCVTMETFLMRS